MSQKNNRYLCKNITVEPLQFVDIVIKEISLVYICNTGENYSRYTDNWFDNKISGYGSIIKNNCFDNYQIEFQSQKVPLAELFESERLYFCL
jgi:hypothetical protein